MTIKKNLFTVILLTYCLIYFFPFPIDLIPDIGFIVGPLAMIKYNYSIWFGRNLMNMDKLDLIEFTGSGDTLLDFVQLVSLPVISILIGIVAYFALRSKIQPEKFTILLYTFVRIALGACLINYGLSKIVEGQFPQPTVERLDQRVGELSPMGLLWLFMGYSTTYSFICGILQITSGTLLYFKKTTLLGSLISLVLLGNIVLLNFTYDVPVKLFSLHLFCLNCYLLYPLFRSFLNLVLLNNPKAVSIPSFQFTSLKMIVSGRLIKFLLLTAAFAPLLTRKVEKKAENNLYGNYIIGYSKNTNQHEWTNLIISEYYFTIIQKYNDPINLKPNYDSTSKSIKLYLPFEKKCVGYLHFIDKSTNNRPIYQLNGKYLNDTLNLTIMKKIKTDYLLNQRGFHWIQEYPFNR